MNIFLRKVVIFATIIIVSIIVIELLLLTKPNVYSYKKKYIENHLDDISVLFMGNSHVEESIIPELVCDSSFNFAIAGRQCSVDEELAERYIPKMKNLKFVVLSLSYHEFKFGRHHHAVKFSRKKFSKNHFKCMNCKYLGIKQYGYWYWSEILNSSENYVKRLFADKKSRSFCDSLGYVKMSVEKKNKRWRDFSVPGKFDASLPKDTIEYNYILKCYNSIAYLCKQYKIKLILITEPVYRTYQEMADSTILQEMTAFAESLNYRYQNVEYYNFFYASGFEDDDFFDSNHLTYNGAVKFSKMLHDTLRIE